MDALTFIVQLIDALAWPCAAAFIFFVFRNEFRSLVPLLRKLKAGPLEAEFEREVREISVDVATSTSRTIAAGEDAESETRAAIDVFEFAQENKLTELARINPRSAIFEAWLPIEETARSVLAQELPGSPLPEVGSALALIRRLIKVGKIEPTDASLYMRLRDLGNRAAHATDFDPSVEAAMDYIRLASFLQARLEQSLRAAKEQYGS